METLGFVSHELKSPVATIMNYAYLFRQGKLGPVSERQAKAINAIESGSKRLVEMVRHYLNLSRIENRELAPVRTRVAVMEDVLAPLLETAEADVEARRMRLVCEVAPDVVLHADVNMMREVFENLLSNAVKYGRDGGEIRLSCRPEGAFASFAVRNEGEGIPADKLEAIFQKFSRLEGRDAVKRQRGTGLGLFITKNIVEAHGGAIHAASQEGQWAEFAFTLPLLAPDEAPGVEPAAAT
jgi:signal transduction histidine kinase